MLDAYLDKYYEKFGEALPTYQIARTRTDEQIIAIIKECIEKSKDVYELGYCTDNLDMEY